MTDSPLKAYYSFYNIKANNSFYNMKANFLFYNIKANSSFYNIKANYDLQMTCTWYTVIKSWKVLQQQPTGTHGHKKVEMGDNQMAQNRQKKIYSL